MRCREGGRWQSTNDWLIPSARAYTIPRQQIFFIVVFSILFSSRRVLFSFLPRLTSSLRNSLEGLLGSIIYWRGWLLCKPISVLFQRSLLLVWPVNHLRIFLRPSCWQGFVCYTICLVSLSRSLSRLQEGSFNQLQVKMHRLVFLDNDKAFQSGLRVWNNSLSSPVLLLKFSFIFLQRLWWYCSDKWRLEHLSVPRRFLVIKACRFAYWRNRHRLCRFARSV